MSRYLHNSHNISVLIYHAVCPAKYRRVIFDEEVDRELRAICLEIAKRYEIEFRDRVFGDWYRSGPRAFPHAVCSELQPDKDGAYGG